MSLELWGGIQASFLWKWESSLVFMCFPRDQILDLPSCSVDVPVSWATSWVICPLLGLAQWLCSGSWPVSTRILARCSTDSHLSSARCSIAFGLDRSVINAVIRSSLWGCWDLQPYVSNRTFPFYKTKKPVRKGFLSQNFFGGGLAGSRCAQSGLPGVSLSSPSPCFRFW